MAGNHIKLFQSPPPPPPDKPFEQVGFYYRFVTTKEDGGQKIIEVPQYNLMAEFCREQKNMCFDDATSYKFDGKKWAWLTKNALNNFIATQNNECIRPYHIDNFVKMIRAKCLPASLGITEPEALINVNNGVINVKTGLLEPHSYKHFFKYCTPVDYNPNAECPAWQKFLKEVFPDNYVALEDLVQRLFGYIMIGGHPFLHKAFVLCGGGRNGKSTFLEILRAVIGSESYSTVSMAKLNREFSIVNIDGKLANLVEETPTEEINAEIFKNMVGGGEVQASHKGRDEYKFKCQARFVFACNEMPIFKDRTAGLEERLVFIPFNRFFKESERDTRILEKLTAELPGILNWALKGAEIMLKDRVLPEYEVTKKAKEVYKMETDPLYAWFKDDVVIQSGAERVSVETVYLTYKKACEDSGNFAYSKEKFVRRFRKLVEEECLEKKIHYEKDLKDAAGDVRQFNVVGLKRKNHLTPPTARASSQQSLLSDRD